MNKNEVYSFDGVPFDALIKLADNGDSSAQFAVGNAYFYGINIEQDFDKAYNYYCMSADANNPNGIYGKGVCLEFGTLSEGQIDLIGAFECYQKASELGCVEAIYALARCYHKKIGTKHDESKAFELYKSAADEGHAMAQYMVGKYLEKGIGNTINIPLSIFYYEKAISNNNIKAMRRVGQILQKGVSSVLEPDCSRAFSLFLDAAEQGDAQALYEVANCYFEGIGTEKNMQKAFEYSKRAALANNTDGLYSLGTCYEYGIGGAERDIDLAIAYYVQAAEYGNTPALAALGFCYLKGKNGLKDVKKSFQYFKSAAENGDKNSQFQLYLAYRNGIGTPANDDLANKWLDEAAKNGHARALYESACRLKDLHSVLNEKDEKKCRDYIFRSAELGCRDAQYEMAKRCCDEYLRWLYISAQSGNAAAQWDISQHLLSGIVIEPNEKEAHTWLHLSAINGYAIAKAYIQKQKRGNKKKTKYVFDPSTLEGRKLIRAKAKGGDAQAQYLYARLLYDGYEEIQQDDAACFEYASKSARQNNPFGKYGLAVCYEFSKGVKDSAHNLQIAYGLYVEAMELGSREAAHRLAYWYKRGIFVNKDEQKALEMFTKLSDEKYLPAIYNLALLRETGSAKVRNVNIAVSLYEKASALGDEKSKEALARIYSSGIKRKGKYIISPDFERAKRVYEELSSMGNSNAMVWLAKTYKSLRNATGIGDYNEQELVLLQSGADKNNIQAINELGKYLYRQQKFDEATSVFQRSALMDDAEGLYYYALCKVDFYNSVMRKRKDYSTARDVLKKQCNEVYSLFNRALGKNYMKALYGLGICHTKSIKRFIGLNLTESQHKERALSYFCQLEDCGEVDEFANPYRIMGLIYRNGTETINRNMSLAKMCFDKGVDLGDVRCFYELDSMDDGD